MACSFVVAYGSTKIQAVPFLVPHRLELSFVLQTKRGELTLHV